MQFPSKSIKNFGDLFLLLEPQQFAPHQFAAFGRQKHLHSHAGISMVWTSQLGELLRNPSTELKAHFSLNGHLEQILYSWRSHYLFWSEMWQRHVELQWNPEATSCINHILPTDSTATARFYSSHLICVAVESYKCVWSVTYLLLMQNHLTVQRTPKWSNRDKRLPDTTDGPWEDVVKLHTLNCLPTLLHGVQGYWITRGHVEHIWQNKSQRQPVILLLFQTYFNSVPPLDQIKCFTSEAVVHVWKINPGHLSYIHLQFSSPKH